MSLKFTGELLVMTMKNGANLEDELTCCFKTDIGKFFDPSTRKSLKFAFYCAFFDQSMYCLS